MTTSRIAFLTDTLNDMSANFPEDQVWMNLQIALTLLPTAELEQLEQHYHHSSWTGDTEIWKAVRSVCEYREENDLLHV